MGCKHNLYARVYMLVIIRLAPVVQKMVSAIHRINHHPVEKYYGKPIALSSG